jgi:hypothetical protein
MDWATVERQLERGFRASPRHYGASVVIERRRPFPLARVMDAAMSEDERGEWGELEYWPGSVCQLLDEAGVGNQELLGFYWDGLVAGTVLVGNGERRYLRYWDELESYRALAAITPGDDPLAVSGTLRRLLVRNGKDFGVHVFGDLPTETTNHSATLVSTTTVHQAYFDLLEWWEHERGGAWDSLAEEHYSRIVEPNHLQRSLDILQTLPQLDDDEAAERWLAERDGSGDPMPDHARRKLFDEWFAAAYEEPNKTEGRP